MYISFMKIENYRTFHMITLTFDDSMNFIVGDNNIGKTNFLALLKTVTQGLGFVESDFKDPDLPIRVAIELSMADMSSGEKLKISLEQKVTEVVPRLYDLKTGNQLPLEYVRSMFYINLSLEAVPRNIVSDQEFKRLHDAFSLILSGNKDNYARAEDYFHKKGIDLKLPEDPRAAALLIINTIYFTPQEEESSVTQLMMAVGGHLLSEMIRKKESRSIPFQDLIITGRDGKKYLPIAVSIDDPEIQLHPYLQRAMISFLHSILSNRESLFCELIKAVLDVDGIDGQLFIVTHSTDALVDDYRCIIRLYRNRMAGVSAACGASFKFDKEIEKHLIMHFPEVKEAMYARCALIVEGETEYGSFPYFAITMGIHFDYHGICLINARGESSISKISRLLREFHIPTVCLYDRDVMAEHGQSHVFYTDNICYEMDVVKSCVTQRKSHLLLNVVKTVAPDSTYVPQALIKKACQKLQIPKSEFAPRKLENISVRSEKALTFYYFAWLYGNKGVIIGRALGFQLGINEIPESFKRAITEAVNRADRHEVSAKDRVEIQK